jgi:hypothetical protein
MVFGPIFPTFLSPPNPSPPSPGPSLSGAVGEHATQTSDNPDPSRANDGPPGLQHGSSESAILTGIGRQSQGPEIIMSAEDGELGELGARPPLLHVGYNLSIS